ncbi:syndecan [Plakobranchus ocellatus]|uniref:Syndecan n=1 Tax=Plakobranchus ocellatus TaxID=259542 RepID=A0AAV4AZT4_9GAST|nr:syndecan [Plakobranchus ocellatus]
MSVSSLILLCLPTHFHPATGFGTVEDGSAKDCQYQAAQPFIDIDRDLEPQEGGARLYPQSGRLPSSDIVFDQDPTLLSSGDGKNWNSDDEDYGVSGSGSGSGAGVLPDVEENNQENKPTPKVKTASTTTTTTTTTTTSTTTTSRPLSLCEQEFEKSRHRFTSYVPKCLSNGDYEALQCDGNPGTADCWCVSLDGELIQGTKMERPNFPNCEEGFNLAPCTHELVKSTRSRLLGRTRPKCTTEGKFESVQCRGSVCFCVDQNTGILIRGTETSRSNRLRCDYEADDIDRHEVTTRQMRPDIKPVGKEKNPYDVDGDVGFPIEETDTIDMDEQFSESEDSSSDDSSMDEDKPGIDLRPPHEKFGGDGASEGENEVDDNSSEDEDDIGKGGQQDGSYGQKDPVEKASEILTQPGILAGIIGGAVVLLLCLVLLIMFIVYRMRKKDEGSYPLDEPRRGPQNYPYVRAPDREYYA